MINKHFRRNLLLQRFSGIKGWLAFVIGLVTIAVCLIALPFLIILAGVVFVLLSLFNRIYLKQKMAQFTAARTAFQQDATTPPSFQQPTMTNKPRQGQTYDHDPN